MNSSESEHGDWELVTDSTLHFDPPQIHAFFDAFHDESHDGHPLKLLHDSTPESHELNIIIDRSSHTTSSNGLNTSTEVLENTKNLKKKAAELTRFKNWFIQNFYNTFLLLQFKGSLELTKRIHECLLLQVFTCLNRIILLYIFVRLG